ncbi:tRNA-uridine aminocarboxypropyltransferase [Colwellia sp. 1_MG-2023]|uniref:tRNA-uridine aminocarboxypropyltransferase n=1 Tax=Colwellia sp. 1_MG-2023 TaxID=3062649 RepID=UPI0026E153F2|nr:tRNA-uridine aminocarboxypropyltransferase [Colwellia sp. 1_MG-2023]MDO6447598.1 tRNA-uridine aminocarboxypropyltransferase [Colwellia sp. 1_MG-2023]
MSRPYCNVCQRPQVSCICHLIYPTNNDIHVVVLQHPSEEKQSKGTVTLLSQSLASCQVFIAEDFTEHEAFLAVLKQYKGHIALVYPSEQAEIIKENANNHLANDIKCIILLDGTWKKAYRIYMINEVLQKIPQRVLPDNILGQYQIRKTQKPGALSTLEACCYGLALMENDKDKYSGLLNQFINFNQMQLSFVVKR